MNRFSECECGCVVSNPQTWFTKAVIKDLNKIIKSSEMGENNFCLNFLK